MDQDDQETNPTTEYKEEVNVKPMTANQVPTSTPKDEEMLIMNTTTIDNMDMESDWLGMDTTALVCSTSTLPQASTKDKQQSQDQEISYSDSDPFDSDYKSVDAQ